jgi:hypothetical protein
VEVARQKPVLVRSNGGMILRWHKGSTERETCSSKELWRCDTEKGQCKYLERKPVPVRSTGGVILRWDSGSTGRQTCPSKEQSKFNLLTTEFFF